MKMETYHIFHLAASWKYAADTAFPTIVPPLSTAPVSPSITSAHPPSTQADIFNAKGVSNEQSHKVAEPRIRAAAAHMVFASRRSQDFITPTQVEELEAWCGAAVLHALIHFDIPASVSDVPRRSVDCMST